MPVTPVPTIDETGIHLPTYSAVKTYLEDRFKSIYGADLYIEPDSQDGQLIAIFALALYDCASMAESVYNAFSPSTAQGTGLSRVVKINGIARLVSSRSSVDLRIVGQAGTTILEGVATDDGSARWNLPATVDIPAEGEITVTATAEDFGAIAAPPSTITSIATPTRGWQSVSNPLAATPGAPVETDAALRRRQTISTALPSNTVLEGTLGAVASLAGVTRYDIHENDSDITDISGVPAHSIAVIVEGGDTQAIATAIAAKKTPGVGTYGTTSTAIMDAYGIPHIIRFYRPTIIPVDVAVSVRAILGYSAVIEQAIKDTVAAWINARPIGEDIFLSRLYVPANLSGGTGSSAFEILSLTMRRDADPYATVDIPIAFNEAASATAATVVITVVP